jgi:hypothetical protein
MSITHHNQTKVLTTWFLNLPLDEYIDNTKVQSLNFESKRHETLLEDQKPKKRSKRSSRKGKNRKANKWHNKRQTKQNGKKELKKHKTSPETTLPNIVNASSPP